MLAFVSITLGVVLLGLGLLGVGLALDRKACPAVATLYGWAAFLLLAALAWFGKFPAVYLAPAVIVMVGAGWWFLFQRLPRGAIGMAAVVSGLTGALLAYPFLRYPGLLAYACWGTDQWGYIAVSKWLVTHSFDTFPVIDNKPGRDWIWYVLTVKDRPLIYTVLATISGASRIDPSLVYYVLPAALSAAVSHGFVLYARPKGGWARAGRLLLGLAIAIQPIWLLHLQYQFLGGVVTGLVFVLIVMALLQARVAAGGTDARVYAVAALVGVLLAGLYTVKITLVVLALIAAAAAGLWVMYRSQRRQTVQTTGPSRAEWLGALGILLVAGLAFWRTRGLVPEPWTAPPILGKFGHTWAHFGAIFGETDILPWYVPDDTPSTDPVGHNPAGGLVGVWLLGAFGLLGVVQAARWFRHYRDPLPVIVLAMLLVVGYYAAPPQGSHWNISRVLPVFGPVLIAVGASTLWIESRRGWARWVVTVMVCVPLVRAAPKLWTHFDTPACRMIAGEWKHPPGPYVWGALGYAYFYEDVEEIDWSKAPESFRAMTHYVPEELRPKMKVPKPPAEQAP